MKNFHTILYALFQNKFQETCFTLYFEENDRLNE